MNRYTSGFTGLFGLIAVAIALYPAIGQTQQAAETGFPDVSADYWAAPFIEVLREANIIVGYPDGQFRPQQPIHRDEFAALVSKAFSQEQVRSIPFASIFADVPEDYWANPAIEEAYETGFLGQSDGKFNPQESVTKAAALVALNRGLETALPTAATPGEIKAADPATSQPAPAGATPRIRGLAFPLASTILLAPFWQQRQVLAQSGATAAETAASPAGQAQSPVPTYYEDAEEIPPFAIADVPRQPKGGLW
ncbi:MAG: S-layer homology domain-containing protein [Chloroflexaceae bacterium]|nr:S-layer homology domain-containing protein [Chloroflexaceae bacterium]